MDELLESLLSSEVLKEDTKEQIRAEFNKLIETATVEARAKAEVEVRAELKERFEQEREQLIEAIDTKTTEFLAKELAELREDIERFRDLEAEYAEKLVEERKKIAEGVKNDMAQLVDTLDVFIEKQLEKEFEELRESIEEVKRNRLGMRIFEAMQNEVKALMVDDGTEAALAEAKSELENTRKALTESLEALEKAKREMKMNEVLGPLQGRSREVMEAILKNTPTERLEEAYNTYITRVLHESAKEVKSEKDRDQQSSVLAESGDASMSKGENTGVLVTGDTKPKAQEVTESHNVNQATVRLRKLAGLS